LASAAPAAPATPAVAPAPATAAPDATSLFRDAGDSVEGTFVLVDVGTGATQTVNADLAGARFSPMSTYKVVIAAAALEVGVLRDEHTIIKWDGRVHDTPAGNRDLDLREAMKLSSNWYFQEVFRRLGEGRMRAFAEKLGFGAATGTPRAGTTWMDGGLTITPVEQAQFFARFAAGQLPVSARTQDVLRRILVIDERGPITLRGKTGTGWLDGGVTIAWLAGTVEQPTRRYAFAAFFRGAEADRARLAERRHAITRRLLARFGALPREMAP
jgi:beta-lactamase class D